MKAWKSMSLCLLLALSVVSFVAASPAPTPAIAGTTASASLALATPAVAPAAPAAIAAPFAALWATDAQSVGGPFAPLAKSCTLHSCTGTGACVCPNGTIGHCVSGNCNF